MIVGSERPSFLFIGAGRLGATMVQYFLNNKFKVVSLVESNTDRSLFLRRTLEWRFIDRDIHSRKLSLAQIIVISVQDDQIKELVNQLKNFTDVNWKKKIVIHTSGALSSEILSPLKNLGAAIASVHPIYSFAPDPRENSGLNKVWFSIEGDDEAFQIFQTIFNFTQNPCFRVNHQQKRAIHIASVFYANFYVALAEMAQTIIKKALSREKEAFSMLNPLLFSSIMQVTQKGTTEGLTGPVKRGDIETIRFHLQFLKANHEDLIDDYILLTKNLLQISNLGSPLKQKIENLLEEFRSS